MKVSLEVSGFAIHLDGRRTEFEIQDRGKGRWAVVHHGCCLSKLRPEDAKDLVLPPETPYVWEFEPQPSSRTDEFFARARFASAKAALDAFNAWLPFAAPCEIERAFVREA
jgi:hypothetical protein